MGKSVYAICLYLLSFGIASCLDVSAQDDTKPVQLDEIVVTPGRFAIDDGTPSKLSLSKHRIESFRWLVTMRCGLHIFFQGSLQAITAHDSVCAAAKRTAF